MTAAIHSKDKRDFVIEMKNFIPRWLPLVPHFPQAKRTLEMCYSQRSAAGDGCFPLQSDFVCCQ
jgi:hypothetical protein